MSMLPKFDPYLEIQSSGCIPAKVANVAKIDPESLQIEKKLASLAELAGSNSEITERSNSADFEERAAIIEFDAGVPREWAEGYARLCTIPRDPDFTEERWVRLIDDAGRFLDRWAVQVAAMGWTTLEVFGVHPNKPDARTDMKGLVPCIGGAEVVAVSADSVTIQTPSGSRQRIFRRADDQSLGRVRLWEIHPPDGEVTGKPERNEGEHR